MIIPEPGNLKSIAQELLKLADKPTDVDYVMWPEPGFRVPEDLAARFVAGRGEDTVPATEEVPGLVQEVVEPQPAPRKPGRPKKIQGGQ